MQSKINFITHKSNQSLTLIARNLDLCETVFRGYEIHQSTSIVSTINPIYQSYPILNYLGY